MARPLNVVYVLLRFPYLTETFIAEEIQALRSEDIHVLIVSLLERGPGPVQPLSQKLLRQTRYAPGLLSWSLWKAQVHYLRGASRLYLELLVTLLRCPCPRRRVALLAKRVVIFLRAVAVAHQLEGRDVELLHAHFAWLSGAAAWICSRLLAIPFTLTVHAFDVYASTDLLQLLASEADKLISISEYNRQWIASRGFSQASSMSTIHCGVDLDKLSPCLPAVDRARSGAVLRILSVGSLNAKKGHEYLIKACRLLKQRGLDFSCTIIGGGAREAELRQEVASCGVEEQVTLRGPCTHPEVVDALHAHDLFVLASVVAANGDRDGIPVVLMEAGAAGLPLISTYVSGIPELVQHGVTGWLVPPADESALADAVITLAQNPALRKELGQNARAFVQAEFNIEANASRLAGVFRDVVKSRRAQ